MEKETLRKQIKEIRSALSEEEVAKKSEVIAQYAKEYYEKKLETERKEAIPVLSYLPIHNEVDTTKLTDWMKERTKVFLPKTVGPDMEFYEYTSKDELMKGRFGVLEPYESGAGLFCGGKSIVFIPGVAFSKNGDRMGYGQGYYDKYLSRFPYLWKAGLCYECQLSEELVSEAHDVQMDVVITENGVYSVSGR
jgi:5-formyltetrahydrofolate cyclo-ligase